MFWEVSNFSYELLLYLAGMRNKRKHEKRNRKPQKNYSSIADWFMLQKLHIMYGDNIPLLEFAPKTLYILLGLVLSLLNKNPIHGSPTLKRIKQGQAKMVVGHLQKFNLFLIVHVYLMLVLEQALTFLISIKKIFISSNHQWQCKTF